ncbi:hypothetical protein QJS10_CPB19g00141 [Acorus calamus]|uniref:Uncharacterized protein n=1 Tax=Acorus calamus TaxID=4465 RepID=A0AAV9CIQ9_ACOCL|nr:hypothetical protein QJS10_CPB19g00141 [Acorus calamus]
MLDLCPPLESIRVDCMSRLVLSERNAYRLKTLDVCVYGDVEIGPAAELRLHVDATYGVERLYNEKESPYRTLIEGLRHFPCVEKLWIMVGLF